MRTARFEVYQGKDKQWYWRFKGANNRTQASGEGHTRQRDAIRAGEATLSAMVDIYWALSPKDRWKHVL